jgi:H+/Cl- antiporter ClcA
VAAQQTDKEIERASTTEGLPISPSMGPTLESAKLPTHTTPIEPRIVLMCVLCTVIGFAAGYAAMGLIRLIYLFTNISFFGKFSFAPQIAGANHMGAWVIAIPIIGAMLIGLLLRYASRAIAGHGIPEAMEQVLTNQSRIPVRMTFLKPLSAAISIGTGAPYGPEGPIIATGGALGSLLGQLLRTTASERKTLLAAGAAAGIAAAFGCPVAAILLAVELLLFEFRPRSIIPVAFACAVASGIHVRYEGAGAMFPFTGSPVLAATELGLLGYALLGALIGIGAVIMTRTVYKIEHAFEHISIHWMWHPAIGAVAVGVIGWYAPDTLGPGYYNLRYLLADHGPHILLTAAAALCVLKFLSWTISLGSGTAGGTLAPVFTIGGALAAVLAVGMGHLFPGLHLDPRVAALMGMAAIFAGSSRALLFSIIFAAETTHEPSAMLPVVCGCAAAYVVSALLMRHSIMTEKMARSGVRVPAEYAADSLDQVLVSDIATQTVVSLSADRTVGWAREWVNTRQPGSTHQGYPVVDAKANLVGVLTRRDFLDPGHPADQTLGTLVHRAPVLVYADCTLRDAADHMANHDIGRLPVIERGKSAKVVGMITRSDLLFAHRRRLKEAGRANVTVKLWGRKNRKPKSETEPVEQTTSAGR